MLGSFRLNKHASRGVSSLFLFFLLNTVVVAQESTITRSAALAVAGNQLPLVERMLNGYIMVGLDINYDEYLDRLAYDVRRFQRQIAALSAFSSTPSMGEQLEKLRNNWAPFKAIVSVNPERTKIRELVSLADKMEAAINEVLGEIATASSNVHSANFHRTTHAALVSQKMARFYLMRTWGLFRVQEQEALAALKSEFDGIIETLQANEESSEEVKAVLKRVVTQWHVYGFILGRKDQPTVPMQTAVIADKVMRLLQEVGTHYISQ